VRLNSIKLSGFKSFAEPTHFMLPGQLVGVVGPNGCGKSNIIDAVRWVLGESRASELRGESMQDVIFSGTTSRKSSSRSSVELIFDNGDHRAGGQWSQYPEIAVKRVLTRDGTSSYYINNQPVRRRDVQDVFLGTGLGPRAYAIIGQGTISRIIESKPEELRLFLEEAAGVSKYKERRRETENRLSDTRENLTRVEDILRELNANLEKLERQAEVAQRYNDLQGQVGLKQKQFWFLKRSEALTDQTQLQEAIAQATNGLESKVADLRHIESELETIRQAHYAAGDQVNQSQGLLYEASAEVGRLEAEIRFVVEGRQRAAARIEQVKAQSAQWHEQATQAQQELDQLQAQSTNGDEQAEILQAQCEEQQTQLPQWEDGLRQAQNLANEQRLQVVQVQQQIQVLAADQRNLDEQRRQVELRRERLDSDKRSLTAPDPQQVLHARAALQQAQAQAEQAQAALLHLEATLPELDAQRQTAQTAVNTESAQQADLSARLQALKALQEKVKTDQKLSPWLSRHGLEGLQALWNRVHIESGWENALEAALRERLSALEVGQLDMVKAFAKEPPPTKLSFYSPSSAAPPASAAGRSRLVDLLRIHDAGQKALMSHWLAHAYTAPDLDSAMASRATLLPGEVIYVPQGHAITHSSVSFYAPDSEQAGLLARAQEIENLEKQVRAQSLIQGRPATPSHGRNLPTTRRACNSTAPVKRPVNRRPRRMRCKSSLCNSISWPSKRKTARNRSTRIWLKWMPAPKTCTNARSNRNRVSKSSTCNWPMGKSAMPILKTRPWRRSAAWKMPASNCGPWSVKPRKPNSTGAACSADRPNWVAPSKPLNSKSNPWPSNRHRPKKNCSACRMWRPKRVCKRLWRSSPSVRRPWVPSAANTMT